MSEITTITITKTKTATGVAITTNYLPPISPQIP
jgi:hypothetical protein